MSVVVDMAGRRFGRRLVLRRSGSTRRGLATWLTICDCGRESVVTGASLRARGTGSCGCLKMDLLQRRASTHGMRRHPLYHCWFDMVRRCTNPDSKNYPDYGGRGITIHPDWLDLRRFISDIEGSIGPRPDGMSLDRVNNSTGNYVPGNVRWATPVQQANNKRPRIKNRDIRSLCEENARLRAELAELRDQTPVQLKLVG